MPRLCVAIVAVLVWSIAGPLRAASPPVEAYGRLPAVEQISLSPSGQRYAFVATIGERRRLVAATSDGQTVLFAVETGAAKVVRIVWAGEDHLLVTALHTNRLGLGYAVSQVETATTLSINVKTHKAFVVFNEMRNLDPVVIGFYGTASKAGRWYGYFGGQTNVIGPRGQFLGYDGIDLYRVDLDSGDAVKVAHGGRDPQGWLLDADGQVIARVARSQITGVWRVMAGASGGKTLATGVSRLGGVSLARGRTAGTLLLQKPIDDGSALEELTVTGAPVAAPPPSADADAIITDPVSGLWIGVIAKGDMPTPHFFDPKVEARVQAALKAFPGLSVRLQSFTPDLARMIVETSGGGDSGTYWLVDVATGKATPIGAIYPDVKAKDVGPIEMAAWTAADGRPLRGVLSLPAGRPASNLPLIVMPHGGPEDRDYPVFAWWAQLFASRGYAVFQPNFRGSSGYGAAFRDAGFGEYGHKMLGDIADGVASLAQRGVVDPKRACIVGWSYGGYAAEAGVTLQHGLYRCAVAMAGLSDLPAFLNYVATVSGDRGDSLRYWERYMGADAVNDPALRAISPARRAAQADAPILLIHGKDDSVVPVEQSLEMQRALKAAGKPVELVTLPNADHWLLHEDTRLAMAKASLDFVLKYDPPDPEPAASAKP